MKKGVLFISMLIVGSVLILQAKSFNFKADKMFKKAHADAFEKMRLRTEQMKDRIDNQVFWCKFRGRPKWIKHCVAGRVRDEMLAELNNLKSDLKQKAQVKATMNSSDPMAILIESLVSGMEAKLQEHDMLPVVEDVAKRKA